MLGLRVNEVEMWGVLLACRHCLFVIGLKNKIQRRQIIDTI